MRWIGLNDELNAFGGGESCSGCGNALESDGEMVVEFAALENFPEFRHTSLDNLLPDC